MMKIESKIVGRVVILLGMAFAGSVQAGWLFGPDNYDDCVLESMKGVTSDKAASFIRTSCRNKFPKEDDALSQGEDKRKTPFNAYKEEWRELTVEELKLFNHDEGRIDGKGNLVGTIFNGNECIRPQFLKIEVFKNLQNGKKTSEIYQLNLSLDSNSASDFKVKVNSKQDDFAGYSIVEATGAYFVYFQCP